MVNSDFYLFQSKAIYCKIYCLWNTNPSQDTESNKYICVWSS